MGVLEFSEQEYSLRVNRARALMEEKNLDALFVTGECSYPSHHFRYFTGYQSREGICNSNRPYILILPRDQEPAMLVWEWLQFDAFDRSWINDVRGYPIPFYPKLAADLVEEKGLSKARIGAELGLDQRLHMPYNDFQEIIKMLPNVSFIDASDIFWNLRMIKTEEEVGAIRKCCQISARTMKRFYEEVHEGMTLEEAAKKFTILTVEEGAVVSPHSFLTLHFIKGEGYTTEHTAAGQVEKKLEKGDIVWFDHVIYHKGYNNDFTRLGVVGKPTSEQIEEYEINLNIADIATAALSPGKKYEEVIRTVLDEVSKLGIKYENFAKHYLEPPFRHMYHGIGMDAVERPYVRVDWDETLQVGMTLAVEPVRVVYQQVGGRSVIRNVPYIEENVVITEDGCKLLSDDSLRYQLNEIIN